MSESSRNQPRPSQHDDPSDHMPADQDPHQLPTAPQDEGVFAAQEWALGVRSNSTGHAGDDGPDSAILDVMGVDGDTGPGDLGLREVGPSDVGFGLGPDTYVTDEVAEDQT